MQPPRVIPPICQLSPAAQYLRMSTEHQQYSIANQSAAIALYAAANNLAIMRSITDYGKSGRTLKGRVGLQQLLAIVESGEADFKHILVYDVSRWGRFPDADESAHYEYLCKRAGINVHYCAEQFVNDDSATSTLLKALKRMMASEYSRELSVKVSAGQRRLVSMGFWQGGNGPFGYQRFLCGPDGTPKHILKCGEWKSIHTDRIRLVPGPKEAVDSIRLAYDLYTKERKSRTQIAEILNQRGVLWCKTPWNMKKVRYLLLNPIYRGAYAYGKHCHHYHTVAQDKWLIREGAFPAIVSSKQWEQAYAKVREEVRDYEDAEMIEALRKLYKKKGKLSQKMINYAKGVPSAQAYINHFGGIKEAYKLVGCPTARSSSFVHVVRLSRSLREGICDEICQRVRESGGTARKTTTHGLLLLNGNITVKVTVRTAYMRDGRMQAQLPLATELACDVLVVGQLKPPDRSIFDYFIIP